MPDESEEITRAPVPNKSVGEMFGIVDKMLGGSRMVVICEDGITRVARIPGKIKKKMWIKEGDVVIVKPWDFQNEKADVIYRYTSTQILYLKRNNLLPEIILNFVGE